jgi:hypothetical protein
VTARTETCPRTYNTGCRCQDCRARHAASARARKHRKAAGITSPNDPVPLDPHRAIIQKYRRLGLTWKQLAAIVGTDPTALHRLAREQRTYITRDLAERITAADRALAAHPNPTGIVAVMTDSRFTKWMVRSLLARGWTSAWLGQQLGWTNRCSPSDVAEHRVHPEFQERIREIFEKHHHTWGPSNFTALKTWRSGHFPADCYNWEDGDFRPIPGSFHHELVEKAATYHPANRSPADAQKKRTETLQKMAALGQWPNERCARTSMKLWAETVGRPFDTDYSDMYIAPGRSLWCNRPFHDHTPPPCWDTDPRPGR